MLSDVPDAETLVNEPPASVQSAPAASPNQTNATNLNLSSATLAALGHRYDILGEAGHGSMGNVYKARDRETGEVVALKLLKPEIANDQQMMDRFKNELLFARKITHKNVCRVHEFNRLGGVAYTSMEFVEGESLRSVLNRFGGLGLRKGIDLAQQMCSGLKEAHAQGIVHRDLKPENVMIDARGNVKIMDFGIARSMESLTRMTGAMVGTPAYMAPEQVAGKPADYRTDVYSLGLILYEVFTGTQAFSAENAVAVAMKQLRESPTPPHEVDPSIPVPIERAILKAVEKEPEKRFQSIAEMEKVFVSPTALGAPFAPGSTTAGRSTQDALAMQQPTIPIAPAATTPRIAAQPKPSRGKGLVLALVILLFVLFAAGAGRWAKNAKLAQTPPPPPPAPTLPNFALTQPAESAAQPSSIAAAPKPDAKSESSDADLSPASQTPSDSTASSAAQSSAQPAAQAPTQSSSQSSAQFGAPSNTTIAAATPTAKPASSLASNTVSAPVPTQPAQTSVEQHAEAAFRENPPPAANSSAANAAANAAPQPGSVLRGIGPSYIWVSRFDREDRAQDVSRKLQGFGLQSFVLPRRGDDGKQVFVVFTGPFTSGQVPSYIDWLKTQGYPNVREVKGLAGLFGRSSNSNGSNQ